MYTLVLLILATSLVYEILRLRFTYWRRQGIAEERGKFPLGMMDVVLRGERNFGLALNDIYARHNANFVGIYMYFIQAILVRDVVLARRIITTDSGSFCDRGISVANNYDEFTANLLNMPWTAWRKMRTQLDPAFSLGNLKDMVGTIDDVGEKLVQHLNSAMKQKQKVVLNMSQRLSTYAVDVVGSVIFGQDIDSFTKPNNELRAVGRLIEEPTLSIQIYNLVALVCPILGKLMSRFEIGNSDLLRLRALLQRTMKLREKNGVIRKDMLQLFMHFRPARKIAAKVLDMGKTKQEIKALSMEQLAAQYLLFYTIGTETTAATATCTLYELANSPPILREVLEELAAVLQRHNLSRTDRLTLEAVQDLKFMDLCIMETVRKYSIIPFIHRKCTENYRVPNSHYTIKKGTLILISLIGIHRDPNYFPNPNRYDPHRFDAKRNTYTPFGLGPKQCIAKSLTMVIIKVALVKILVNFSISQPTRGSSRMSLENQRRTLIICAIQFADACEPERTLTNLRMWLLLPILFYCLVFLYVRHVYSYWGRKGFPSERVSCCWSFLCRAYKREFRHVEAISEAYQMGRERLLGIYCFFRPVLLVRSVDLARTILEQANGHFNDGKWDLVRGYRRYNLLEKLAPMFSTPRLSDMFRNVERVADHMMRHLVRRAVQQDKGTLELDMQQLLRIYAINIIGNLVYGLDVNNFEQQDHIFTSYVSSDRRRSSWQSFTLSRLQKKSSFTYRLRDLIKSSVEQREDNGLIRKDILQLLVKFRNGDELCNSGKQKWHVEHVYEQEKVLSIKHLAKVAEDMLKMSLESIAATTTLALFEVLQEPLMLEKLQAEVKELNVNETEVVQLEFEQLNGLKYMDMCLKETLRKYPPVPIIERICRKSYTLPNSRYTIGEGKTLMVPVLAIQRDEKYFSEPLKYKPLRFLHDQLDDKHCAAGKGESTSFMGYGMGGAQCVARNFAKMVIKTALVKLLQNFHLELEPAMAEAVQLNYQPTPFIRSKDGLVVKLKMLEIKSKYYLPTNHADS
ncbi:uncharacterized protein LOC115631172 [Scaptodrosophila lebanonensis]|uniref:Uncharacterized protein LOC115631172 n=1 Tax=Drosophila lebanonensis TaxID=7225 RepID=A0A6J2U577_DROLE|nr:uncharacterized protein LOC115631172 [Scaptodrosophila lebanonensis]